MCWGIWKHPVSAWGSASVSAGAAHRALGMLWKTWIAPVQSLLTAVCCWGCTAGGMLEMLVPLQPSSWETPFAMASLFLLLGWCFRLWSFGSDTRIPPQAAEGHTTRQKLLLSNTPHQIHLPHVQGVPVWCQRTDRYTGHTALRTVWLPSLHIEPNQTSPFSALWDLDFPRAQLV